jgi:hypothetical protein
LQTLQKLSLLALTLVAGIVPAFATDYSVSVGKGTSTISLSNGSVEVQSTVVGPNMNANCPAGRLLMSMDSKRPFTTGTVAGFNLDGSGSPVLATMGSDPDAQDQFLTNDNDIIALGNGDVLLVWGYHSVAPLTPSPPWFGVTYKGSFGPGVRRSTIVYRSTDCGQSFHYSWRFDTAKVSGDSVNCAFPNPPSAPPAPQNHFNNGGSDGQLTTVGANGSIYVTMQCVGEIPNPPKPGKPFSLSGTHVDRTYVMMSPDKGATWHNLGHLPFNTWRTGVVPLSNGDLAFSALGMASIAFAHKASNGSYTFDTTAIPTGDSASWSDLCTNPVFPAVDGNSGNCQGTAILASTLITRVPGSDKLVLTYPTTIKDSNGKSVDGYQLNIFDPASKSFGQTNPILPVSHAKNHFIMHMVADDLGAGPILLYWFDVDASAAAGPASVTIRGRFVFEDGSYSSDFVVATNADGSTRTFSLPFNVWRGDYHTAGGYLPPHFFKIGGSVNYTYFPIWIEGDQTAHFSRVTATSYLLPVYTHTLPQAHIPLYYPKWVPGPPPVELKDIAQQLHATRPALDDDFNRTGAVIEQAH